ncbi:MAG: tRNA (N6-threonylcarbamoyladenosine(37)-N6)-methyltransferase TrmO [Candidatus Hadarchaeota archaeon]
MKIEPIGTVRTTEDPDTKEVVVREKYSEGLDGIETLDEIVVCYWMHELDNETRKKLKVHPRNDPSRERRGVFALRSPMRPNPIGITKVELLERRGNALIVRGLDAVDGSPVVDVKCTMK